MLRIFSPEKPDGFGFEPANLGTRGQHANHQTTESATSLEVAGAQALVEHCT
jgi:hypothetical protein